MQRLIFQRQSHLEKSGLLWYNKMLNCIRLLLSPREGAAGPARIPRQEKPEPFFLFMGGERL